MNVDTENLLNDLTEVVNANTRQTRIFLNLSLEQLNHKPGPDRWSILECIEHLNLYAAFYIPETKARIRQTKHKKPAPRFKSGFLGDYFANSMLPKAKMKTMKTFKDKNPNGRMLDLQVLHQFIAYQEEWLQILAAAKAINLNKTKCALTIPILKLRLGDTFRFIFAHDQRHIAQAHRLAAQFNS